MVFKQVCFILCLDVGGQVVACYRDFPNSDNVNINTSSLVSRRIICFNNGPIVSDVVNDVSSIKFVVFLKLIL